MSAPDTRPETRAEPSPDAIICDLVAAILGDDPEAWPEGDLYANAAVAEKVARTQPDAVEALGLLKGVERMAHEIENGDIRYRILRTVEMIRSALTTDEEGDEHG